MPQIANGVSAMCNVANLLCGCFLNHGHIHVDFRSDLRSGWFIDFPMIYVFGVTSALILEKA